MTSTSVALLMLVMLGAASALPRPQIVRQQRIPNLTYRLYQADQDGQFHSSVVQDDQQQHDESGVLVLNNDGDGYVLEKKGMYKYISPEGEVIQISYTAGKDGFHAVGNAIPVAPAPVATF